jgi:bis(5'-nucleosyl)-tetraphosphatase (symmetrical)
MILLVGDVQGCAQALDELLAAAGFSPSRDRVVLLGDLVNRGPDSLGVLRRAMALGNAATCLLGNHDLHLLAVAHGVRKLRRGDTFADVLQASDAARWLQWLAQQPLAHLESGWLCVHAGLAPQWTAQQALSLAAEVQGVLRGAGLPGFLHDMYGDQPDRWDPTLQGQARWRMVVNTLTRIRFCTADGVLDFKTKEGAGAAPAGYMPWFEVPARQSQGQPVAFGHWSTLGLINRPDLLALDTGCVWGGALSAVRIDGGRRELVQVPCPQAQRPGT